MDNGDDKYNPAMLAQEKKDAERFNPNKSAATKLGSAEEAASGGLYRPNGGAAGAKTEETQPAGLYKGGGASLAKGKTGGKGQGKFKGFLKKRGATIGLCIALTFGAGGIMAGTQLFQPFSLVAQFQESFNSMHVSANVRSSAFFKAQMQTGRVKDPIGGSTIFGSKFKISSKQQAELKTQGIEVDNDFNGTGKKVLKYANSNGEIQIVTADAKTKVDIPEVDAETGVKYKAEAVDFKTLYANDTEFFHAYNSGSMTWRGQFANWFGKNVDRFLSNNKLTRNMWNDYKTKKAEADGDGLKAVKDTLNNRVKGNDGEVDLRTKEQDTVEDDAGNRVPATDEDDKPIVKQETTKETVKGTNVSEKLDKIKTKFSQAVNAGCAVMNVIGAVSLMVSAAEALQIINLVTSYMETVDKTKAGYGDEAPINELATSLSEKKSNTNTELVSTGNSTEVTESGVASLTSKKTTTVKSAMESAGVSALYGDSKVDTSDASVQSFNLSSSMKRILGGIGVSMTAFKTCTFAKGAVAVADAVTDGLEIAACVAGLVGAVFTFGASAAGGCSGLVADILITLAIGVGVGVVLSGVIATLTPVVSSALERDLVSTLGGEDLGNALTSGALRYMGSAHRANGGSLGTVEKYQEYAVAQAEVIAQDAKEERLTLSPFDITSKNTFMGTILTQMMSLTNSSGLMNSLTSASTVMSSSIASLTPSVSAVTKNIAESLPDMDEYAETCPYLASIGAIGDAFCNPYVVTDMSTINEDPYDVIKQLYSSEQIAVVDSEGQEVAEEDLDNVTFAVAELGDNTMKLADTEDEKVVNVKVKDDTELAKYIKYCGTRESDFGYADQNIANEISEGISVNTGSSVVDGGGNGAIGSVPVFGDIIDIVESAKTLANLGYVSGENCVANDSDEWNNEYRVYQRFAEDQSLAESMGVIEKSAVAEYLDEYYEQNPVDNSYEGMLARYSGMEKETVSDLLDVIAYYEYVNEYDPSERYAFDGATDPNASEPILMDNEYVLAGDVNLPENIIYADIRNRSFAV